MENLELGIDPFANDPGYSEASGDFLEAWDDMIRDYDGDVHEVFKHWNRFMEQLREVRRGT